MTTDATRLSTALAGRYRLERELGAGGMATVYLAQDLRHDRKVALKVLRPELSAILGAQRFLAEIKTTANLQHPHILSLFDSGEADGLVFYVMPYVEGESLRARLTREKQLPVDEAVRIAREVADALDYAHRHGVIHRDIKPENILLHDGRALVADFGIALAAARSEGGSRMTETGMSLGTPYYMSPEQAMGEREITAKSDVYALGCVTYEMLTGEPPFTGPTAQAIIARVMTEEPRPLVLQRKTIPPHVEAAVLTALSKLPADRFATAAQFAEALSRPGLATVATTPLRPRERAAGTRSRRARALALAPWIVALLALAGAAWSWRGRPAPRGTSWQYLELGEGLSPNTIAPSLALSPDGTILAVRENGQNGRLYVKRRSELHAVPVPGTERAAYPAFSPDGQWISFIADGRLKKVRVGEGGVTTIADSANAPFGGSTWLDDGSVVYTGPEIDELSRVPAAGGPPAVVLRDSTLAGLGLGNPAALPDGRGVLFTVCTSGCVTMSVHVLDLRTGAQRVLLSDAVSASYLPTGHLLYFRRDGSALAAPFDLEHLRTAGPAVAVLDGVMIGTGSAFLAWSPAGTLVYLQGSAAGAELEPVRVGRDGAAAVIDTAWRGGFNSFAVSPDGRRLAVGVGLTSGTLGIWIKQLDRGPFSRLTFGGQDRRPAWSPDGRDVAFIRDSLNGSSVYARLADGSAPERPLARLDRQVQEVSWSPDGRWLLLRTDNGGPGAGDIVGVRTTGDSAPVPLVSTPFTELHPAASPDGHWLAYTSIESGTNEVYVRPFPSTTGGRWQVSNGGGSEPRWSPDGRELFYLDGSFRLVAAELRTSPTFEVSELRPLFDAARFTIDIYHTSYDVLPGGRGFLFLRPRQADRAAAGPLLVQAENWFAEVRARSAH
ncbi:MAG TPA: protein kinase [Gemmatimonadales bacterium]|nr:protein kinase [Gemmatimonadales bacterium]